MLPLLAMPPNCLVYPSKLMAAECVLVWCCRLSARGCWSAAVVIRPFSERTSEVRTLPGARSCEQRYMVHCGVGGKPTQRACVDCARITGTITCTHCSTSKVVNVSTDLPASAYFQCFQCFSGRTIDGI